jgi:type III secretion system FlhB-like substrate exporter
MKLAILGSRSLTNSLSVASVISNYHTANNIDKIISGGQPGVDSAAIEYAKANNIPWEEYLPQWEIYGEEARYKSMSLIIKESDAVLVIWDGKSQGAFEAIKMAKEFNKELIVSELFS